MVNIVMLVRNRLKLTTQAIESLYSHTDEDKFTLTIVDDASEPLTKRLLLQTCADRANCTLLRLELSHHVLSQLKNIGVLWTQMHFPRKLDNWLYLSDNDVWFAPGWMDRLVGVAEANEKHRFKLFGGQVHPYHQRTGPGWPCLNEHGVLDGPSWLMRWRTWATFGPLDPTTAPGVCKGEDCLFCDRVIAAGGKIGVVEPHVVVHTGLTNSEGRDAPGRPEREKMIPAGVIAE